MKTSRMHARMAAALPSAALLLLLAGCAASEQSGRVAGPGSRSPFPSLQRAIDRLLPDSLFPPANAAVRIVAVRTGEVLYELQPDLLLTPASNQKLLTAAAALNLLGPRFRFPTLLRIDTTGGRSLTISGSGDPLLTTADLDTIAARISAVAPPGEPWQLRGDVSAFDDQPWGRGWMWDDEPDPTAMEISPLSINGNCVAVVLRPGRRAGDPVAARLEPEIDGVSVTCNATTAADTAFRPLTVTRRRRATGNLIAISGEMAPCDSAVLRRVSLQDPAQVFLALLAARVRAAGVPVRGTLLDTAQASGDSIIVREHTLDSVVCFMNTWSDNLSAECLLKTLGRVSGDRRGSAAGGSRAVRSVLGLWGMDTSRVVCADGSGVSRYNLVSVRGISDVLVRATRDSMLFPVLLSSLPLAGRSGTLSGRMRTTPAGGTARAKTGTMTGVSALSGYVTSADGELLAFSCLMQNYPGEAKRYRAAQDSLVALLAAWTR